MINHERIVRGYYINRRSHNHAKHKSSCICWHCIGVFSPPGSGRFDQCPLVHRRCRRYHRWRCPPTRQLSIRCQRRWQAILPRARQPIGTSHIGRAARCRPGHTTCWWSLHHKAAGTPSPDYTAIESAGLTASSFGSRVMLTGQDADWHVNNFPGARLFDGPRGFLRDAISWAGSGTGLGLVMLGQDGIGGDSGVDFGFTGFSEGGDSTNNVVIPGSEASFAINGGLTSGGISNWDTAAHDTFTDLNTSLWNGINIDGDVDDNSSRSSLLALQLAGRVAVAPCQSHSRCRSSVLVLRVQPSCAAAVRRR